MAGGCAGALPAPADTGHRPQLAACWSDPVLLFLCTLAGLLLISDQLLQDPDSIWHVAVGADIWRHRAVPWTDTYSHTFAGQPWIAKEWLSQLILFAAHAAGGWRGVAFITALSLAGLYGLLFAWLEARLRASLALAATLVALMLASGHFLARPHVFALLALFAWMRGLVGASEAGRAPAWPLLVVVTLWANLHGSVTLAFPLLGLIAFEAWLNAPPGRRLPCFRDWTVFGVASVAAACVTPYGVHSMLVTLTLFGGGETMPFVIEWQPLAFDGAGVTAITAAALVILALSPEPKRNAGRILVVALLSAMMVRHNRFLDMFSVAVPLAAAGPLARMYPRLRPVGDGAGGWPARLRVAIAAVGCGAVGVALAVLPAPRPSPAVAPEAALRAARELGVDGPVYNNYDFGGFLIANGVPTFIDGRTDQLFLGGFISAVFGAVHAPEDAPFLGLIDRYGVRWALVKPHGPEAAHLARAAGWRRVYDDATASVFIRR